MQKGLSAAYFTMSLPSPPKLTSDPNLRLDSSPIPSNRPKSQLRSSCSNAGDSRPGTSLQMAKPLPVIFTPDDLMREIRLLANENSDDSSDDDSFEGEALETAAKNMGSPIIKAANASSDPVRKSDPFYSAKSVSGYEEDALAAEKKMETLLQLGNVDSNRRDALLKQIELLRQSADRARDGFSICYDKDLDGASEEEDIGIFSLMHYSGRIGDSIIFNSRGVECGNLHAAMRVSANDYILKLSFDCNDPSTHNGWFCFSMRNLVPNKNYRLCIINMTDNPFTRDHLGSPEFQMMGYSSRQQKWKTVEAQMSLEQGSAVQPAVGPGSMYLKFNVNFSFTESWVQDSDDSVTLAAAVPYSQRELTSLIGYARMRQDVCAVSSICRTSMGNDLVAFTITTPGQSSDFMKKRMLMFCARARACSDITSSWAAHGMVRFLCGGSADARELLRQFVFVIIPLMNPDGVASGYSHLAAPQRGGRSGARLWSAWDSSKRNWAFEVVAIRLFVRRSMDPPGGAGKASTRPRQPPLLFCELCTSWGRGGLKFTGVRNGVMSSAFYLRERTFPIAWVASAAAAAPGKCRLIVHQPCVRCCRMLMWPQSGSWLQMSDVSFPIISEVCFFCSQKLFAFVVMSCFADQSR